MRKLLCLFGFHVDLLGTDYPYVMMCRFCGKEEYVGL